MRRMALLRIASLVAALLAIHFIHVESARPYYRRFTSDDDGVIVMPTDASDDDADSDLGTRWAVLIAGSSGYSNYRHQADVCHAYQVLKRGGLKDENIVVFMYDDIAENPYNPRPGQIINNPLGIDVYAGVPKDYTGADVTVDNFFAVLLGNQTALTGGSGKVVDSGPNDHIFIFYSDHGGPGVLGMPNNPSLFANDFVEVLQLKHNASGFKEMVIYIEACESGSIFEGLLPDNLNIYATTASNAEESSWGTYCPGMDPSPPEEYFTCLGDLYSVAWMEDSEANNLELETLKDQYRIVKSRTSNHDTYISGSHVMEYGDANINAENVYMYLGNDPANANSSWSHEDSLSLLSLRFGSRSKYQGIHQRDADLLFLWHKYNMGTEGSHEKLEAQKELVNEMSYRMHLDASVSNIGKILFGDKEGPIILNAVRPQGKVLVDDWSCLKSMIRTFELHCGSLTDYGLRHTRAFANICNAGIDAHLLSKAAIEICASSEMSKFANPMERGFSA